MAYRGIRPQYRKPILPAEMRKGLRIIDVQSGFVEYTRNCVPYKGGWTSVELGPRFLPREDEYDR